MLAHTGWYMWWYHFVGTYIIASVTLAYAMLAAVRLRPARRKRREAA